MFRIGFMCSILCGYTVYGVSFITPCKLEDADCIKNSANAAIPYFVPGIPAMTVKQTDPLFIPQIVSDESGFKLIFKDTTVTGLKGAKIESAKFDVAKQKLTITIKCNLMLAGDYKASGQLLLNIPVEGQGKFKIELTDTLIKVFSNMTTVTGADGKQHWHIEQWRQTLKVLTGAVFNFDNLYNGNELLSAAASTFANSNWQEMIKTSGPSIGQSVTEVVIQEIEKFFSYVPVEELYVV